MSHRIFRGGLLGLSLAAGVLLASDAWAVFKCTGADGKVSYQDRPCAGNEKQQEVQVAKSRAPAVVNDADVSAAEASAEAPAEAPQQAAAVDENAEAVILELVSMQLLFDSCLSQSPGRYQAFHQRWRNQNKAMLARYESAEKYRELHQRGAQESAQMWRDAGPEMRAQFCNGPAAQIIEQALGNL